MEKENPKHKKTHPCCFLQKILKGEMVQTGTRSFYESARKVTLWKGLKFGKRDSEKKRERRSKK